MKTKYSIKNTSPSFFLSLAKTTTYANLSSSLGVCLQKSLQPLPGGAALCRNVIADAEAAPQLGGLLTRTTLSRLRSDFKTSDNRDLFNPYPHCFKFRIEAFRINAYSYSQRILGLHFPDNRKLSGSRVIIGGIVPIIELFS